jgi:hypothetical protein
MGLDFEKKKSRLEQSQSLKELCFDPAWTQPPNA